ncbi:unnamed protein product [Amoebophrya sp. A25]|nr:unnamed protein product [Amoebophrya sp. A25]|eukprot:GSA25T00002023001.1
MNLFKRKTAPTGEEGEDAAGQEDPGEATPLTGGSPVSGAAGSPPPVPGTANELDITRDRSALAGGAGAKADPDASGDFGTGMFDEDDLFGLSSAPKGMIKEEDEVVSIEAESWGESSEDIDRDRSQLANHPYPTLPWLRNKKYIEKEREAEDVVVTKGEMLNFLNAYLWFLEAGGGIPFTVSMWFIFVLLVNLHGDVEQTFSVKRTLSESVSNIVAHPLLGNAPKIAGSTQETVVNMHCDCNCQPREALGRGVQAVRGCDNVQTNQFAFMGDQENIQIHRISGMVTGPTYTEFAMESTRETIFKDKQEEIGDETKVSLNVTTWEQVISVRDSWFWLQHGLLPVLWQENQLTFKDVELETVLAGIIPNKATSERAGRMRLFNQMIGGMRLQQKKLGASGCPVNKDLRSWYGMECRSDLPQTQAYGPGTEARNLPFQPVAGKSGIFEAYFDIGRKLATAGGALEEVEHLLVPNEWIDENTEWLEFQAAFFNAQVRLFSLLKVRFTFQAGGYMEKEIRVSATSANLYPNLFYYVPDVLWLSMIAMLFQQELFEVLKARRNKYLRDYLKDRWNFLDWCTITLGIVMAALWFDMVSAQAGLATEVGDLPATPSQIDESGQSVAVSSIEAYHEQWGNIIDRIQELADQQWIQYNLLFWYTLILMLRFFKQFQGQPRLALLSLTLYNSMHDMVHYLIVFFTVFFNYALGGHALFGALLEEWSTMSKSINTSFLAILGEFDFNQMFELSPITATLWFWSFMILMTFILLNLLIAMIFDQYHQIKRNMGESKGVAAQTLEFIGELNWNIDWLLQRRKYLKLGILNPEMESLFKGTKSVEDIYEDFCTEGGQDLEYGRKTVLQQRADARQAQREQYEKAEKTEAVKETPKERRRRQRAEGGTGAMPDVNPEIAAEAVAKLTEEREKQEKEKGKGGTISGMLTNKRMSLADAALLAKMIHVDEEKLSAQEREKERMRTRIDVLDLEQQFNVEPRFARHLMLACKKHVDEEVDFAELRQNEMKQLVTDVEQTLKDVDKECQIVEDSLKESMRKVVQSCLKLDGVCQATVQETVDLHPRVGLLVPRGCRTSWGERAPGGGRDKAPASPVGATTGGLGSPLGTTGGQSQSPMGTTGKLKAVLAIANM